ncbi:PQQ-binding-like beta-propeller repeat protein [Streptomyces sp. NPDC008313]|uniref:outer membrane protein assembly factor BamB family protein n=1 Tax=Streptomyces sp. NPDC008313 TaxID=3364826 RepID=UPI0036E4EB9F
MTQPPNQPPQGGFGAPQDPPPQGGGFGAPQTPPPAGPPGTPPPAGPPQPGYGYPQQPGPYSTPGPYAPPRQPGPYNTAGPYAQPGPYNPQPGYGSPAQPQGPGSPGTPPPGGGSKNPFRGKPAMIIGAAVAALLVICGTVWAVGSGGDDDKKPVTKPSQDAKPSTSAPAPVNEGDGSGDGGDTDEDLNKGRKPGEAKVLWYKEAPDAPGSGADAPGMWITGESAVKAAYKQLFAYGVEDGRPSWDPITFPQKICATTRQTTSDDRIVIAYMSGVSDHAKCDRLVAVDLATGERAWTGKVTESGLFDSAISIGLTITGDTLMVARSQSATAYDMKTGKKRYDLKKYGQDCYPSAFAGGEKLIAVASCAISTKNEHDEVRELDPATGKAKWTKKFPKDWKINRVYSVAPLVLYLTDEDGAQKGWNITTLKNDGTVRSQADIKGKFAVECGWGAGLVPDLQTCSGVVADANTLYLPTLVDSGPNEVVAVSLESGKERWRVKSPADAAMTPLRRDGTNLVAYVHPPSGAGGRVVALPTTGSSHKTTKLLQNPEGTSDIESTFMQQDIDYVDGRFYISASSLSGNDESKEKLMMAFGK